ncbi:MAG: hypothetical protein EBX40_08785, partial [Gammaproteobacteria bacterium]|nr:hypothetical protein [Gammaproteobacteria bacterium]
NFVQVVVQKPDEMSEADFEKALTRARLKFECTQQKHEAKIRPHILSATPGSVIYKGFAREDRFGDYFEDFKNPQFMASAAVTHARFATNTLPVFKNIQPLPRLANNGENNALPLIKNLLAKSPEFRNLIGLQGEVDLTGWSDSAIMSMYMDYLVLLGYPIQEIVASTIQPYVPKPAVRSSDFYNLFATPFEGPNASIVMVGRKEVAVVRDKNGFRPQRGVIVPDEEGQNECIYSGSELGPFETHHGQVFDLPPATPLLLNLAEGRFDLYEPTPEKLLQHQRQMEAIAKPLDLPKEEPVLFNLLELAARKLRAGWNPESDQIIQSLRQKSASPLVSMGASAAIGALVKKPT